MEWLVTSDCFISVMSIISSVIRQLGLECYFEEINFLKVHQLDLKF
jgi:hypothetical protein